MATFLCVWELGGGLGHVMRLKPIAEQLQLLGHRVVFVVQSLPRVRFLSEAGFECIQAPLLMAKQGDLPPDSMARILARRGYWDSSTLKGLVSKWLAIYQDIAPDLIVIDYAPTAILSAKVVKIPVVAVGSGFSFPPRNRWACNLKPWNSDAGLRATEERVVANINTVGREYGLKSLCYAAELFYGNKNFIYELPETDIYKRSSSSYVIKKIEPNGFPVPKWRVSNKIKVAGYLKGGFKENERIIEALEKLDVEAILAIPGYQGREPVGNVVIYKKPIDLIALIKGADVAVFHAGNTINDVLLNGKVSLLAPTQVEQFHFAGRMQRNGYGEIIDFDVSDLTAQFLSVIKNKHYKSNVERVREKYSAYDRRMSSKDIATQLIDIVVSRKSELSLSL